MSSRRRRSSPDVSSGSVFARPCVFATTRVFAWPVFGKCIRDPTCLRDDACLRRTCLREVSSRRHVSSRRRLSSPDLSSGRVFARPMSSRRRVPSPDLSSRSVFSDAHGFTSGQALARTARSGGVFATTRRPTRVFAGNVSSDAHVSSLSSPGMCLLTPTCLRRPCVEAQPWTPCVFKMCLRSSAKRCTPPGDRNVLYGLVILGIAGSSWKAPAFQRHHVLQVGRAAKEATGTGIVVPAGVVHVPALRV